MPEPENEHEAAVAVARINARQIITVTIITAIAGLAGAAIQSSLNSGPSSGGSGNDSAAVAELKSTNTRFLQQIESMQIDTGKLREQADALQNKNQAYAVDVAKIKTAVEALLNLKEGEVGTLPDDNPIKNKLSQIDSELRKLIEE